MSECLYCGFPCTGEFCSLDCHAEYHDGMVEAPTSEVDNREDEGDDRDMDDSWMDADALASAGRGTDEDYGVYDMECDLWNEC